jgi:hypothetical protein
LAGFLFLKVDWRADHFLPAIFTRATTITIHPDSGTMSSALDKSLDEIVAERKQVSPATP